MNIAVLGAGAFGTALAISLAGNGPVTLWARDPDHAAAMARDRVNDRRLPGLPLPSALRVTPDLDRAAQGADTLLLAAPMQRLRSLLQDHGASFEGRALVACCKGIELNSGMGPVQVIADVLPGARSALLTGPSFARTSPAACPPP